MYSDIDLDANGMETEYQASFEDLLWFVNTHLANTGVGNFENEEVEIVFNRDILINESESIDNCVKSVGILSNKTIIGQHPWISDVGKELQRVEDEKKEIYDEYSNAFNPLKVKDGDLNEE
jgi:SPP1 family phage portal protein